MSQKGLATNKFIGTGRPRPSEKWCVELRADKGVTIVDLDSCEFQLWKMKKKKKIPSHKPYIYRQRSQQKSCIHAVFLLGWNYEFFWRAASRLCLVCGCASTLQDDCPAQRRTHAGGRRQVDPCAPGNSPSRTTVWLATVVPGFGPAHDSASADKGHHANKWSHLTNKYLMKCPPKSKSSGVVIFSTCHYSDTEVTCARHWGVRHLCARATEQVQRWRNNWWYGQCARHWLCHRVVGLIAFNYHFQAWLECLAGPEMVRKCLSITVKSLGLTCGARSVISHHALTWAAARGSRSSARVFLTACLF